MSLVLYLFNNKPDAVPVVYRKDILSKNQSDRNPSIVRPDKNCIFLKPLDSKKKPVIHFTGLFFW
jgi:hypothetical protein